MPSNVVNLIRSFPDGMKTQISINGELVDEKIDVDNGPETRVHNGSNSVQPVCLMVESWAARVEDIERAGTCLLYKYDGKLFQRSTRGPH